MGSDEGWGTTTNAMASMVETAAPPLAPGTRLNDRFKIIGHLGAGGMGVVYRARDEQLAREVAIKVHARTTGAERLLREATAMAQLSHPNVVTVYEVGEHEKAIFIAMELIEGKTARNWREDRTRGWREVLQLYLAAGDGLAAIHAAGLIHRDFKPENVLVGEDGRVRVADLGLARAAADPSPGAERLAVGSGSSAAGTPAYMSPEQRAGGEVGERADQYAFAASMQEALGDLSAPRRVRRALSRALADAPADRWPSLAAMLAELKRDPRPRNTLLVGGTLLAAAATMVVVVATRNPDQCGGGAERFRPAWNPTVREALRGALARSEFKDLWPEVETGLDDYQKAWLGMHREACETHARGEQSAQLLDQRMLCLDRRLQELKSLTTMLTAPGTPLKRSRIAVVSMTPVAVCGDVAELSAETPFPENPQLRAAVASIAAVDSQAKILNFTGQWAQARDLLRPFEPQARALGYSPLVGDIEYHLAAAYERLAQYPEAEAALRQAHLAAEESRSDRTVALALTSLVRVVGWRLKRFPEAHQLVAQTEAAIKRLRDPDPRFEVEHVQNLGLLYSAEGNIEEEVKTDRRMLSLAERAYGPDDFHVAVAATNLGAAMQKLDPESPATWSESLPLSLRALAITEKLEQYASALADMHVNVAPGFAGTGNLAEAEVHLQKALSLGEVGLPKGHPQLATYHVALAELRSILGDFAASLTFAETALKIRVAALGENADEVSEAEGRVAEALLGLGRHKDALPHALHALAIVAATPAAASVWLETLAGTAELGLGHLRQAETHLEGAVALATKVSPPVGDVRLAAARFALARLRWQDKKRDEAHALAALSQAGFAKDPIPRRLALAEVAAWLAAHPR